MEDSGMVFPHEHIDHSIAGPHAAHGKLEAWAKLEGKSNSASYDLIRQHRAEPDELSIGRWQHLVIYGLHLLHFLLGDRPQS